MAVAVASVPPSNGAMLSTSPANHDTASQYSINSFKPLLSKLLNKPADFTPDDYRLALLHQVSGQISAAQVGSFLASLRATGVWNKPEMVHVLVEVMKDISGEIPIEGAGRLCDWTMTGESGHNVSSLLVSNLRLSDWILLYQLLNVALPAAIVAAGAGCKVVTVGKSARVPSIKLTSIKTGNDSAPFPATPSSGDVITALNVPTKTLPPFSLARVAMSRQVPFLHIYSPAHSPRVAKIAPLRRELGFPTIYHSFAALITPTQRDYLVIGVHDESLGHIMAEGCKVIGAKRAWIIYGADGVDGLSPSGDSKVWDLALDGTISEKTVSPGTFGARNCRLQDIQLPEAAFASPKTQAKIISAILKPRRATGDVLQLDNDAYDNPVTLSFSNLEEWICLNAAALIYISGRAESETAAMDMARRSLHDGRANHALEALRDAAALAVDVDEQEAI